MPEQMNIPWVKSREWRLYTATGAAAGGIGTGQAGMQVTLRFSNEWVDIANESFAAEIDHTTGTITQAGGEIGYQLTPLYKIEEAAVRLPPDVAGGLIIALLGQFASYSPNQQKLIRDAFAKLPV